MVWLYILGGVEKSSWLLPVWDLPDLPCFCRLWIQELEPGNGDLPCQGAVRTPALRELCRGCCWARSVGRIGLEQVCLAQLSWGRELWKLRLPSSLTHKLAAYSDENHFAGVQIQFLLEMNLFKLLGQLPIFQWITPVTCPWFGVYTDSIFICAAAIYRCMCYGLLGWETLPEQYYSALVIGKHICCSQLFITNITHVMSTYVWKKLGCGQPCNSSGKQSSRDALQNDCCPLGCFSRSFC